MTCAAFWKHTNIRPGNKVYPCCRFKYPIADFNGDLEQVLHSKEYEDLRNTITPIAGCEKCYQEEDLGHKSLRQEFNEKYDADTVELKYLEIGLDNLCNLYCDGCNSEFSTRFITRETSPKGYLETQLPSIPGTVDKILFLGGEPLITDKHLEVLKTAQPGIEIVYNTNGMFIPSSNLLKNFKVHFIVSIDGYDTVNDDVRGGSKWQKILDFISWVKNTEYTWSVNTVLHKNNIHDMQNLAEFISKENCDWYVNILTYPENLSIKHSHKQELENLTKVNLPNAEYIKEYLNDILDKA